MGKIGKLIKQLEDDDPSVREHAILELGDLRDTQAVGPLIKVIQQDTIENRRYAIVALSEIGDHSSIEILIFCLMDYDEGVRLAASRSLGKFSSPQAISALMVSLKKDPSVQVKSRSALSLGGIGSEIAVPDLLTESKLERPPTLRYSIDTALKMIAKKNGYESMDELIQSVKVKVTKHLEKPETEQLSEKEIIEMIPNLWAYIRKFVIQQLEGIQTMLSVESNEKVAETKIAEILGDKFWQFSNFLERKNNLKLSEFQTDVLWQMCWDTSRPIRVEIFQMIKDHRIEIHEIERYRKWLDTIEDEKEKTETIYGEPIMPEPAQIKAVKDETKETAADLVRSISGEIEEIMDKYSAWKGKIQEDDDKDSFEIE